MNAISLANPALEMTRAVVVVCAALSDHRAMLPATAEWSCRLAVRRDIDVQIRLRSRSTTSVQESP